MTPEAKDRHRRIREVALPIVAFAATLAIAVFLRVAIRAGEYRLMEQRTALALQVADQTIDSGLQLRIAALARLGQRMSVDVGGHDALFRVGARQFIADFRGLVAVGWQPLHGAPAMVEAAEPAFAERVAGAAQPDGTSRVRMTVQRAGPEVYARISVPVRTVDGKPGGQVIGLHRLGPLVDELLHGFPAGYEMELREGDDVVYRRPAAFTDPNGPDVGARRVREFAGHVLELRVWPAAATRAIFLSRLPDTLLTVGAAIGLLFALTLRYYAVARTRAREAEFALRELQSVQKTLEDAHEALKHRNAELQDFAFAASHDLQEPLRKIGAFGDRLRAKYAHALDDNGRDYLARMQGAASRMQQLITALLEYSRVSSHARPLKPVDLNQVAHEVVADLETLIEQAQGEVVLGALPVIVADPVQMRQLLQNLIANALKFRAPGRKPCVRVSAFPIVRDGRPWCRFSVADNGIGFENQYAERIFAPFKRLHARDEYEGTGIGLAIVRRIVERHHGSVSATGVAGEGATFVVDLPAGGEAGSSMAAGPIHPPVP